MRSLHEKTLLVTGGASGLGEACVRSFLEEGANVVILDIDKEKADKLIKSFPSNLQTKVLFFKTDITSEDSVREAIKLSKEKFGMLHGAVNCAGVGSAQRTASSKSAHDLQLFKTVIDINLVGTFNVCRLVAQQIISDAKEPNEPDGERGVLINVASVAAFDGQIGQVAYSASKGGVVSMTLTMARDLSNYGIRVVTIAPGTFDTPMMNQLPEEQLNKLLKNTVFPKRLGKPQDFSQLVLSIVKNPYINGETIRLDAAMRMPPANL
jgi:NAD(P)-dependent dehydrogenase (short-subunit alcohol dehydrogenase family)